VRLSRLVEEGILLKCPIAEGAQQEYVLTQKGIDLYPVLMSLMQWGDKHRPNPKGVRLYFVERSTGKPVKGLRVISEDGRELGPEDVQQVAGPGLID